MAKEITIDDSRFTQAMRNLHQEIGGDSKELIKMWSKVLLRGLIRDTPYKKKKDGEGDIYRNFSRAVNLVDYNSFRSDKIKRMIRDRNYEAFQAAVDAGNWQTIKTITPFDPSIVDKAMDRRGHVRRDRGVVTLDRQMWKQEMNRRYRRLGKMKKAYAIALSELGENKRGWYNKPEGFVNVSVVNGTNQENPFFDFTNATKGIGNMSFFFKKNVRTVERKMQSAARKIISHRAKQEQLQ